MKKFLVAAALASFTVLASCGETSAEMNEHLFRLRLDQTHAAMMRPASKIRFEGPNLSNKQSRVLELKVNDGSTLLGHNDKVFITRESGGSTRVTYFLGKTMVALKDGRCERIDLSFKPGCTWLQPHEWTQVYELALAFGKRNASKF